MDLHFYNLETLKEQIDNYKEEEEDDDKKNYYMK